MRALLLPMMAAGFLALTACGGGDAAEAPAADAGGDPDEVVCCEMPGAKGTSIRSACLEAKGKVLPSKDCE